MKKNYLKTTKLNIQDENKTDNLRYLGDWCFNLEKKLKIKSDYYLKSQDKKEEKFEYILKLKDRVLLSLIDNLNNRHNINKGLSYWNFLIGPWLIQFLQVLYDRWLSIENNADNYKNDTYTILGNIPEDIITPDEMHTAKHFYYHDLWNHFIYGEIIKFKNQINVEIRSVKLENLNQKIKSRLYRTNLKKKIINKIFFFSKLFYSKNKTNKIIFSSDLHYIFQIKLFLKFKQFPIFLNLPPNYSSNEIDKNARREKIDIEISNGFEEFVSFNFLKYLPKSLLENYKTIEKINTKFYQKFKSENYFIPQLEICDQLKFFLASQERSNKILYQHGGAYGFLNYHYRELIEIQVSDYFLTFGWDRKNAQKYLNEKDKKKIIEFYPVHLRNKKINTQSNNTIYLILDEFPNYFYEYHSNYDAHTYRLYFQGILDFISNLDETVKEKLIVRLYPEKHNEDAHQILKNKFPWLKIDYGNTDLNKKIIKSKLCIIANNSTTFLDTFRSNVPTILFWDKKIIESRKSCEKYLELLSKIGVYYDNPQSAALFCNNNKNIYKWWNDKKRKLTIKDFLRIFANDGNNNIDNLYKILNSEKKN
ncbi:hypothetical protein AKH21_02075 [Pelagibacteraceae bacterium GOM-A5]|nr:hypothetical protein AKH21_02075 [Pelagibacteraceae bacterium GOM-A5]